MANGMRSTSRLSLREVIRWLLSGVVERKSLVTFLTSPLVLFIWYTVPLPWEPRFADAAWVGPTALGVAILLVIMVILLATVAPKLATHADEASLRYRSPPPLTKQATALVLCCALLLSILGCLLAYERFWQKTFLIKWPRHTETHNTLIGGTFKNVDFDGERLMFYVCTEVPDRAQPTQPWIWRCWLDQHPPDVELHDGLWQATCRFGNEEPEEMDRPNPTFEVVPVVARRGVERTALPEVVDSSPSKLRETLLDNGLVSCAGSVFTIKRTTPRYRLPNFTAVIDTTQRQSFGPAPELRYTVCPNATISWEAAPGEQSVPSYAVFFDGVNVGGGTGTSLSLSDLLGTEGGPAAVDDARWHRKERLELKISHDPILQHHRNMYLYRREDRYCPPAPP